MYCPKCFDQTISINSRGVIDVIVNHKQIETGRFIFHSSEKSQIRFDLKEKFESFAKWYGTFNNPETIKSFELTTSDYRCSSGCAFAPTEKISIIDILINYKDAASILKSVLTKYDLDSNF